MKKIFDVLNVIKQKLFVKKDKIHSEKYYRRADTACRRYVRRARRRWRV